MNRYERREIQIKWRPSASQMSRTFALILALSIGAACVGADAQTIAEPPIASPAIDESLFKDGAIQAREVKFEGWYTRCQEIVKVKRRVCNLLSTITDKDGKDQGSVLIATTDTGAPAMMIALSASVRKDLPIVVQSTYKTQAKKKTVDVTYKRKVSATRCDVSCKYIFPFDPRLVFALNAGNDVAVTAVPEALPDQPKPKTSKKKPSTVMFFIHGGGFADALKASTQSW